MMNIQWDKKEMARLYRAMDRSLEELAGDLDKEIKEAQVVPKKSGALENSQKVTVSGDTISVTYDTPYAARLYYHPEYNFSHEYNKNAKGMWLEDWINGEVSKKYAKHLKEKV